MLEGAREQVVARLGQRDPAGTSQIQFRPAVVEALQLAADEARNLGHGLIGTEHVLLGLTSVRDDDLKRLLGDARYRPG